MARTFRRTPGRRVLDRTVRVLLRVGLVPGPRYLLTVTGRTSGLPRSTPVTLVDSRGSGRERGRSGPDGARRRGARRRDAPRSHGDGGGRWLVAPYGEVAWVRNARAAGEVRLSRGCHRETARVRELDVGDADQVSEAARVLRAYARRVPHARPYFDVAPSAPVQAFVAEAHRRPVFRLLPGPGADRSRAPRTQPETASRGSCRRSRPWALLANPDT